MDERLLRSLRSDMNELKRRALKHRKSPDGTPTAVAQGIEIQLGRLFFEPLAGGTPSHDGQRGDIVFDTQPSAGGTVGAVCVTAPSTWKRFGSIAA